MSSKALVVGSGAIGLRTAIELLNKNVSVILRSAHHPLHPSTCSTGSGGLWMPFKCQDVRLDQWAKTTLDELLRIAHSNTESVGDKQVVEIVPTIYLTKAHNGPKLEDYNSFNNAQDYLSMKHGKMKVSLPEWTKDPRLSFQHLTLEMLGWQNQVLKLRIPSVESMIKAGYSHGWLFRAPIVDGPRMLTKMLDEISSHPFTEDINVEMDRGGYSSLEEIVEDAHTLGCNMVFNCTGMGSSKLCNDESLVPGRGILLHYDRSCARSISDETLLHDTAILTEDGPWASPTDPVYIIPRGDVFVVGGSYYEGDVGGSLSDNEKKRLIENASLMGIDTAASSPVQEWVGFRPARPTVRMEIDENISSLRMVHSYGHGGSGWTAYIGVAKDSVALLGL